MVARESAAATMSELKSPASAAARPEGEWAAPAAGVELDSVLEADIGQFGRHQARSLAMCMLIVVFVAWSASEYVFTTARIDSRCVIPECESSPAQWAASWSAAAAAGTCARRPGPANASGECTADDFDQTASLPCTHLIYENTHSVAYDFDLGCAEWRRSLIGTIRIFGTLLALPLTGWVSDRWGRRVALAINVFNTAWLGLARVVAGTYWGFTISELVEALLGSGGFSCAYILMSELVGPKYRVAVGATINSTFAVGQVTMAALAKLVPDWRRLTLVLYAPQFIALIFFFWFNESVRWLLSKGKHDEAIEVLEKVAAVNGRSLSKHSAEGLQRAAIEEKHRRMFDRLDAPEPWLPLLVLRSRALLLRCLTLPVLWITTMMVYYGLSINAVGLAGDRYWNYAAVSAVEIPGYWTAALLLQRAGRRPALIVAYWGCAACQLAYVFINDDPLVSLLMYLIGKYSIAIVMTSIYVYTAELFPTKHRHSLFAYCSMVGRVGSMVAPLTPAMSATVWPPLPFALFSGFAFVSGALTLLLPETRGSRLPERADQD